MILFNKQYDGESLIDTYRDFSEALESDYNPLVSEIPQDKYGFQKGTFTVTIEWKNDD